MPEDLRWKTEDEGVEEFIATYLVSFTAWDVLVFLQHNASFVGSCDVLASILYRGEDEVCRAIDHLTSAGAVAEREQEGRKVYTLTSDPDFRAGLDRFAELTKQRAWRMELVGRVLTRLGREQRV